MPWYTRVVIQDIESGKKRRGGGIQQEVLVRNVVAARHMGAANGSMGKEHRSAVVLFFVAQHLPSITHRRGCSHAAKHKRWLAAASLVATGSNNWIDGNLLPLAIAGQSLTVAADFPSRTLE